MSPAGTPSPEVSTSSTALSTGAVASISLLWLALLLRLIFLLCILPFFRFLLILLLLAARQLGVEPECLLMIGDSINDVLAARAAGCPVVCVPYGYNHGEDIADAEPDRALDEVFEDRDQPRRRDLRVPEDVAHTIEPCVETSHRIEDLLVGNRHRRNTADHRANDLRHTAPNRKHLVHVPRHHLGQAEQPKGLRRRSAVDDDCVVPPRLCVVTHTRK